MAAAVDEQHRRRWASMGLAMIEPEDGVRMLAQLLHANRTTQAAALPLVRARLGAQHGPFFSLLVKAPVGVPPAAPAERIEWLPALAAAPAGERKALLVKLLAEQLVKVLALPASLRVDTQRSLMDLGMDSLMAMELRNRIQAALKVQLAAADLLKGPSVEELADDLLGKVGDLASAPSASAGTEEATAVWKEGTL